jgi:hypothetical protein
MSFLRHEESFNGDGSTKKQFDDSRRGRCGKSAHIYTIHRLLAENALSDSTLGRVIPRQNIAFTQQNVSKATD